MSLLGKAVKAVARDTDIIYNNPVITSLSTWTGRSLTTDKALAFIPFFASVRLIASAVAGLPLIVYREGPDGHKERARNHELYRLLHDAPNPRMTSFVWRQTMQMHLLTWGNAYSEVERTQDGRVAALWPLRPDRMMVRIENDERVYEYLQSNGTPVKLRQDQVLHIPGLGFDGVQGYSVISLARQSIALGDAAEEWAAQFYKNNATPPSVLKAPGRLSDDALRRLRASWQAAQGGPQNAGKTAILEEGLDLSTIGIPAKDAQFIEIRRYQKGEMATLFGIPPHMIGDVERSTSWGSGIEEQGKGFVTFTLNPWLIPWEQQIKTDLIGLDADEDVEFLRDGLLQGTTEERYRAYQIAITNGWMSHDEVRRRENMPPLPNGEGERFYYSNNMQPVSALVAPEAGDVDAAAD